MKNKPTAHWRNFFLLGILFYGLSFGGTEGYAQTLYQFEPESAKNIDLYLSSRHGIDQEGQLALQEYRAGVEYTGKLAPKWRTRTGLNLVTENKLDTQTFARLEVDTLYAHYEGETCGARIGVQQVVWGGADRLQVLDVIHPLDLRESYFGDWQRKRLPLAMLNLECDLAEQSLQLLLVPQSRFNRLPSNQGRFTQSGVGAKLAAQGVAVVQGDAPHAGNPSDWSGGVQWRTKAYEGDVTLNLFHGWQGEHLYRSDGAAYREEPARFNMVGASYTRPIGPLVFRVEGAHTRGIIGYVQDTVGRMEPVPTRQNSYLIGVDYSNEPWFFSAQLFDRKRTADQSLLGGTRQQMITLAVRHSLMQDRLHLTAYAARDTINSASYVSLTVRHEIRPQLLVSTSVERFSGNSESFGLFQKQSRIVVGFEYHWK
jgi:hypothetical protein